MPLGGDGELEIGKLGVIGGGGQRTLQLEQRRLVLRCGEVGRRLLAGGRLLARRRLPARDVRVVVGRLVGGSVSHAHQDGAVIDGLAAEPRHPAVEHVGGVALDVAERRLDAQQSGRVRLARGEAQLLGTPFEAVGGRDLVGSRQGGGARLARDVLQREPRRSFLGDLDLAAADADRVEHDVLGGEWQADATAPHVAPVARAISLEVETQDGIENGDPARFNASAQQRADIEPGLERAGFEKRLVEASVLVGHLDVVESELGRGQQDEMHLAADLDLAAEQLGGLRLEDRPIVVPVDDERRRKQRAQHQDQQCRQREQKRVHLNLCPRLGSERVLTRQAPTAPTGPRPPATLHHANAKILPGLRIFNGSSAFFMAAITSIPGPCSCAR